MRIWITGAGGFLGLRLCRTLAALGEDVVGFVSRPCSLPFSAAIVIDLAGPAAADLMVREARALGRPDVVIHLASLQPAPIHSVADYVRGNINTTANLADALRKTGFGRCIYTSTVSVYGRQPPGPIRESQTPNPDHPYGVTKLAAESLLKTAEDLGEVLILRLASLFGSGQGDSLVDGLVRRAKANEEIRLLSRGRIRRDVLYIDDVVTAISQCLQSTMPEKRCTFNLGSGSSFSIRDYAVQIVNALHSSSSLVELDEAPALAYDQVIDIASAQRFLSFRPRPFPSALKDYLHELPR